MNHCMPCRTAKECDAQGECIAVRDIDAALDKIYGTVQKPRGTTPFDALPPSFTPTTADQ